MKKAILCFVAITSINVLFGQELDSAKTAATIQLSDTTTIKENKDSSMGIPEEKIQNPVEEKSEIEVEQETSEPKIIYYQTTPDPKYETRYRPKRGRNDIKTLAGSMNHSGGFGALSFRTTKFNSESMVLAGMRGGWIINRTLGIGVEAHGIIPTTKYENVYDGYQVYALGGYGGLFMEMIVLSNTVVHLTFPVSGGAGWIGYEEDWNGSDLSSSQPGYELDPYNDDVFWYVEPGANLEVNISRNFRLDFGVSRRFTQDFKLVATPSRAFEKTNYYITLKVGGF